MFALKQDESTLLRDNTGILLDVIDQLVIFLE